MKKLNKFRPLESTKMSKDRIAVVMHDFHGFVIDNGRGLIGAKDVILSKFGEAYSRGTAVEQAKAMDEFTDWPNQGIVVSSSSEGFDVGDLLYLRINSGQVVKFEDRVVRLIGPMDIYAKKDDSKK